MLLTTLLHHATLAALVSATTLRHTLHRRTAGDITYYDPGLGACGKTNGPTEMVAAMDHATFDATKPCDRKILIKKGDRSVNVTVVDRCGGCKPGDLDLSPEAFKVVIGDLGIGRSQATWEYV